jgi:hypothetical protein
MTILVLVPYAGLGVSSRAGQLHAHEYLELVDDPYLKEAKDSH